MPTKAALVMIFRNEDDRLQLLLGLQAQGPFAGLLMGPGGKFEKGESVITCLLREAHQEMQIRLVRGSMQEMGTLISHIGDKPLFETVVYRCNAFRGAPKTTEAMSRPTWFDVSNLPWAKMPKPDQYWLPAAIAGQRFVARTFFGNSVHHLKKIEIDLSIERNFFERITSPASS
jgi:8-oxo-dGTP diphosphatase